MTEPELIDGRNTAAIMNKTTRDDRKIGTDKYRIRVEIDRKAAELSDAAELKETWEGKA